MEEMVMRSKKLILSSLLFMFSWAFQGAAIAIPTSLEGMGMINQWTDYENATGEMPLNIWGTSDAITVMSYSLPITDWEA